MPSAPYAPFPGLYCPGLIEASSGRGMRSGGSRFPGLYCPGLIEAGASACHASASLWFPGLYCPGLIEASNFLPPPKPAVTVSGALLPRPH